MLRVYRYRLYPTEAQAAALWQQGNLLRRFYNAALEQRISAWRKQRVTVGYYDQAAEIAAVKRECPEYAEVHTHLLQDALKRLELAFRAFFRRCKAGEKPGFPRFKGEGRYNTFAFQDAARGNGAAVVAGERRVRIAGAGNVKFKYHSSDPAKRGYRPMRGVLKTIAVTLGGDGNWYVLITREMDRPEPLPSTGRELGGDPGLHSFMAFSDGEIVGNPRPLETARIRMERAQRKVDRREKGSHRRDEARQDLAHAHAHVANVRRDFQHKLARRLVDTCDRIALEDNNLVALGRSFLARSFHDAAHGAFNTILAAKAEEAGRRLDLVEARNNTQDCSGCGEYVPKGLDERIHACPRCGLVLDRDVNAARNVLKRGQAIWRKLEALGLDGTPAVPAPAKKIRPGWGRRRAAPAGGDGQDPRSPHLER